MPRSTRRRFLQAAAALPAVAAPAALQAGEPAASADEVLAAIVRLRFKHLTEDQLKTVRRALRGNLAAAEALKGIRLEPTDEPATIFVADVAE